MEQPVLVAIMGPTGSGKSALAERLADELGLQLINADAFQVYRGMDIGTNKSPRKSEYLLVDEVNPSFQFGLGEWLSRISTPLSNLWKKQQGAVVVGGTGLYIRALFEEFSGLHGEPDPDLRQALIDEETAYGPLHMVSKLLQLDPETTVAVSNPLRVRRALERLLQPRPLEPVALPPFHRIKFGLWPEPGLLNEYLAARVRAMWDAGWPEEVSRLMGAGIGREAPGFRAIGYQDIFDHLNGELVEEEVLARVTEATRRYAKRQRTWLRSEPHLVRVELGQIDGPHVEEAAVRVLAKINSLETNQ